MVVVKEKLALGLFLLEKSSPRSVQSKNISHMSSEGVMSIFFKTGTFQHPDIQENSLSISLHNLGFKL